MEEEKIQKIIFKIPKFCITEYRRKIKQVSLFLLVIIKIPEIYSRESRE